MGVKATGLRCEYRENPLGVDAPAPRLSWILESDDAAARNVRQSAYQVIVGDGDAQLWDSGKVDSFQSVHVSYAGQKLRPAQRVSWKVRLWDQDGKESNWSEPATWTMGLLVPKDWRAKWITAPMVEGSKQMPIFRRAVAIDKPVARAIVFYCGLGQHELEVNEKTVAEDVIDPGWTNYKKTCLYATHDVTAFLKQGDNAIGMMLGNGMYNVVGGRYTKFKGTFGPPKLIFQMYVEFTDGTSTTIVSDESWQTRPGPITFSCIFGGEDFDARIDGDESWQKVAVVDGPGGALRSQAQPPIRVMQTFKPLAVTEPKSGVKVYDLGQNMSGRPRISVKADAGAKVTLKTGELLIPDGLVSQKRIGSPVSFGYTCRGGGEMETWNPRFTYHGFRYVQAEGAPLESIEGQFTHSSARVVGTFECSNDMFNKIHALIDKAILSNMQSVLTDCPHREKLGWLEQAHLMAPAIMFNYDVPLLYEKICRDIREAQYPNGFVPTIAPQYTVFGKPHDVFNDSPEWGSAVVINPWLMYQRYGDKSVLNENYEAMKGYVEYLHGKENEGIIEFGLGDWYDIGLKAPGVSQLTSLGVTGTAIYYFDTVVLRNAAELLRNAADAQRYAAQAQRIAAAFNAKYFNSETKQYDRGSQTANAMPLAMGMVAPEHRDAVLANLVNDIRAHNDHITAGDIGFLYVVRALGDGGRSDVIADLLKRTDPPSYGSQLARGATTLTEAWDANPNSSQNHLMLGHAEIWFYEYLAGIRIDMSKPPGRQIVIKPAFVSDVDWVKAKYELVFGVIESAWKRKGTTVQVNVTIPANVIAIIELPGGESKEVGPGKWSFEVASKG